MQNIVYKISNSINSKIYFGITQQPLNKRWQQHKCNSFRQNYPLYNAMKKYGIDKFKIEVVFLFDNKEEMFEMEKILIKKFKTFKREFGYNNSLGGENSRHGSKLTEKQRKRISDYQKSRMRKPHSEDTKAKIGLSNKGKKRSDVFRQNLSNIKKGNPAKNKKSIILNNELIFESLTKASLETGVSIKSINNNLKGRSIKTKVGIWEYHIKN